MSLGIDTENGKGLFKLYLINRGYEVEEITPKKGHEDVPKLLVDSILRNYDINREQFKDILGIGIPDFLVFKETKEGVFEWFFLVVKELNEGISEDQFWWIQEMEVPVKLGIADIEHQKVFLSEPMEFEEVEGGRTEFDDFTDLDKSFDEYRSEEEGKLNKKFQSDFESE